MPLLRMLPIYVQRPAECVRKAVSVVRLSLRWVPRCPRSHPQTCWLGLNASTSSSGVRCGVGVVLPAPPITRCGGCGQRLASVGMSPFYFLVIGRHFRSTRFDSTHTGSGVREPCKGGAVALLRRRERAHRQVGESIRSSDDTPVCRVAWFRSRHDCVAW